MVWEGGANHERFNFLEEHPASPPPPTWHCGKQRQRPATGTRSLGLAHLIWFPHRPVQPTAGFDWEWWHMALKEIVAEAIADIELPFPVEWRANHLSWDFFPSSEEISSIPPKLSTIEELCPQIGIALSHSPHDFWDIPSCYSGLHILFFCFHLDMAIKERYGLF